MAQDETQDQADPVPALGDLLAQAGWRGGGLLRRPRLGRRGAGLLVLFVLIAWAAAGIYKVGADEEGVELRFGRWVGTEVPGLHYHLPYPVGTVLLPKVTSINELRSGGVGPRTGSARMLTGDENLVEADYSVLWKIKDAGAYLFHVQDPVGMIRMTAETAMRAVIGRNPIQAVLSDRRQQIAVEAQAELQHLLDAYGVGVQVLQVQLQRVDPPAAVIDAFNDVQRARADQVRASNEAEAYRNDMLPHARGDADHVVQDAEAYRTQAIDQAKGDVSAFLAAQQAYSQAPEIFAWRVYLDSMDEVLRHAGRVIVDTSGKGVGSVVPYLPLGEVVPHPPPAPAARPGAKP